jgi:DNA topoisomerase-1
VIVESPAKARTIGKYLGKEYAIRASMGHVIDLPVKEFGIDLANRFKPKYVTMKGKTKIVQELRKAAKRARNIYLAPDPDREGEAIAWHIAGILSKTNPEAAIHRILLNEITRTAVKNAVKAPQHIDMHKVNAQQARRILDRIVGYKISPFLWKAVYRGLSAGRVQSVALRLICEREADREAFKTVEYWTLEVSVKKDDGRTFTVKLAKIDGKDPELKDKAGVQTVIDAVKDQPWAISDIVNKLKKRNPYPPFITSTLQQEAARRLHFSASKTMTLAQQLYEGLDIGDSRIGLITYIRTDSTRLSDEAKAAAAAYIGKAFGPNYVPEKPKEYRKSQMAQDAHEAIRPSQIEPDYAPDAIRGSLTKDQYRLYALIWNRFLASQMKPAEYHSTTVDVVVGRYTFRTAGSILKFDGFIRAYAMGENGPDGEKDLLLPDLEKGESLAPVEYTDEQHFTQPPPRYSEATLVKELESQGIGRPSTYAQIIDTLKRRKYVEIEKRRFTPSLLGKTINSILVKEFPDIFNVMFTAKMENELDKVESGEDNWTDLLAEFYTPLEKELKTAQEKTKALKKSLETRTDEICAVCGKGNMVIKWGRNGRFLACSEYPKCRNTRPIEEEEIRQKAEMAKDFHIQCKLCNAPMVAKRWKQNRFLGCSRYPECHGTQPYPVGVDCPQENCPGYIAERYSQRGKVFYSCSEYPRCKFASWDKPRAQKCETCGAPFMVERITKSKGFHLRCLQCKSEVLVEQEEVE